MFFALPIAFTLAVLAVPIVALYILKVRLRRVAVSTNLFWKQIYDEKPPRSYWKHFRNLFSLLLQLLCLLLIVLAIADPYLSRQLLDSRRLVLVIDNSASMRATDVAPSRLDAAKSAALGIIDGLRFRDEVAIVLAGSTPEVVVGMSENSPTLRDAISAIPFSDSPTQLTAAIDLGRRLIGQHPHGQVVVLTDGCVDSDVTRSVSEGYESGKSTEQDSSLTPRIGDPASRITDSAEKFPVEYRLFATDAPNVGITQLQVRRSLIDPLGYEILASVRNASANPVACRLELSLNDFPVDVIPLKLGPEERWSRSIEKTSLEGGRLRGVLTQIQANDESDVSEKSNGTDFENQDFLHTDDSAWALLPGRRTQRVLIVSQGNLFLQKVFEANPLVEVTIRKNFPERWPADSIIVLHGKVPSILPPGDVFVVDPIGSCDQWEQGDVIENPIVTEQDKLSPLMNHIRLENVLIPDAKQLLFRTPPHSLAKTLSGETVYAEVKRPEGKCLVLSVNLDRSDLAFRTAFPIMTANLLGWFLGSTGELQPSLSTGAVTTVTIDEMAAAAEDLELISPDGGSSPVVVAARADSQTVTSKATDPPTVDGSAETTIGPLNEVGVWAVIHRVKNAQTRVDFPDKVLAEVAVNLADDRETDLRKMKEIIESPHMHFPSAVWFSRPFWFYLILMACVLTTLEWFLYQRRLIS
ncbi:MAG: BatA and WFA domain-containing protein [Planctomycetaceae bacterium]